MAATGANGIGGAEPRAEVYADRGEQRPHGIDDQFGLVEQNPVAAVRRHHVTAVGGRVGQAPVGGDLRRRLMRAGDDDHRDVGRRNGGRHGRGFGLQDAQVVGHGVEALRLAPVRLHRRVELGRQLAYLADQSLERPRRSRAEQLDERARRAGVSAGEQGERGSHDADPREKGADDRGLAGAVQQSGLRRRAVEPLHWRVDQHEAGDLLRVPRRVAAHDQAAEGVADQDDPPAGTEAAHGPVPSVATTTPRSSRMRANVGGDDAASLHARPARS